jgi:hypothetical protein
MKNPFRLVGRRPCDVVQDRLLRAAERPDPGPQPADIAGHLAGCAACRELSEALHLTQALQPAWPAEAPPPGLALRTLDFLEPHWPRRAEKPLNREEVRLLWTGGLGMLGATAALLFIVFDVHNPLGGSVAAEGLVRIGARLTLLQFLGGTILSVALLVIRAARSTETEPQPRPDRNRGGSE